MKEIIIVGDSVSSGSVILNGIHRSNEISKYRKSKFLELRKGEKNKIFDIHNSIIIFMGLVTDLFNLTKNDIDRLHNQKNIIVVEPIDKLAFIDNYSRKNEEFLIYKNIDGVLFTNNYTKIYFKDWINKLSAVIPQHYDIRFNSVTSPKDSNFYVKYLGAEYDNIFLKSQKPDWLLLDFTYNPINDFVENKSNIFSNMRKCNCHFSHRISNSVEFYFKPGMKFAAASATESAIILSRDKSNVEILEDYPLYVSDDISDVQNKYELARSWFGTNKWNDILEQINLVREKTDLKNLVHSYLQFFNELEESNL
jgi:hypothetical protein